MKETNNLPKAVPVAKGFGRMLSADELERVAGGDTTHTAGVTAGASSSGKAEDMFNSVEIEQTTEITVD